LFDAFLPFTDFLKIADLESAELLMGRRNSLAIIFPATKNIKKQSIKIKSLNDFTNKRLFRELFGS
jgi:hypothetical protein